MTPEVSIEDETAEFSMPPTRWQENHGNFLLTFVVVVALAGATILVFQQTRFVPPRFPDADMIDTVPNDTDTQFAAAGLDTFMIRVTGAASDTGMMRIAIYGSDATFNDAAEAIAVENVPIVQGEATWNVSVNGLPESLAVAAFHDENNDGALNRNRFDVPTERYGFSQNARGQEGPPTFLETMIKRPAAGDVIELFVR